ncbi:hypothetical protein D3C86_1357220 [compost metagenome]
MAEPPVHGGLLHAEVHTGHVGHQEQHREPEQRAAHVPDRHVEVIHLPVDQRQHQRHAHEGAAHHEQDVHLPGNLEPLHAIGNPRANAADAGNQPRIPHRRAQHRPARAHQRRLEQSGQQEQGDGQPGHWRPAVGHGIQVDGANAAEGQPGHAGEQVRFVQLDRGGEPGHRRHHQPHHGAADEQEHDWRGRCIGSIARGVVHARRQVRRGGILGLPGLAVGKDHPRGGW